MSTLQLTLSAMANGGLALGRDERERVVFVSFAIPGERVIAEVIEDKKRFARARLVEVLEASPDRVEARCPHFGLCGACHFQHVSYPSQLRFKKEVVQDQLSRIGGLDPDTVRPALANPSPWAYGIEATFYVNRDGQLGYWSFDGDQVIGIETCHIIRPQLVDLLHDLELDLPELFRITVRVGSEDSLLAVVETTGGEVPSLEVDFPISAAFLLPDGQAANLIGDSYLLQNVKDRDFRVSASAFFYPSLPALDLVIETTLGMADIGPEQRVLELYSGVGTLTSFLAEEAAEVQAIEENPDAVSDSAINLDDKDNVAVYQGRAEEILPMLEGVPDVVVLDPPTSGISTAVADQLDLLTSPRLVYVSSDVATLARDGRRITAKGYALQAVQPIDMYPQNYRSLTVSLWTRA